jgi:nucleoside-triphosphatase THEP1
MSSNILLTGRPGIGKTTIIQKIIQRCPVAVGGFLTAEIREHGMRVGFTIEAIRSWDQDGSVGKYHAIMAHVNSRSPYRVGKYGVNILAIEEVGITALREGTKKAKLLIIDEIGRMEMYSELFKKEVIHVLEYPIPVLGVIQMKQNPFLDSIRSRNDVTVIQVTSENRDVLPERLYDIFGLKT